MLHLGQGRQQRPLRLELLHPLLDHVVHGDGTAAFLRQDVLRDHFPEVLEVRVRYESFAELLREQRLGKGEDERHGPRQVDEVDLAVPEGQGSLAAGESSRHFGRRPD